MREIKFRAKRLDTGEWVYGTPIFSDDGSVLMVTSHSREKTTEIEGKPFYRIHSKQVEVEPKTLGQFTGLHGKDGREMYEDDIVKSGNGRIWTVRFGQFKFTIPIKQQIEAFGFYICPREKEYQESGNILLQEGLEVIGNTYEHPELLNNK